MLPIEKVHTRIDQLIWACWFKGVITPHEAAQEIEYLLMCIYKPAK